MLKLETLNIYNMSAEKAPIVKAGEKIKGITNKTSEVIGSATQKTHSLARNILRYEVGPVEDSNIITTPFKAAGNVADAAILNPIRRIPEVTEPIASGLGSLYYTTLRVPFNPLNTLFHPIKYGKNVLNVVTSTAKAASNVIKAPLKWGHELIDRGITRPTEYLNHKIDNIPLVGKPIAGITNWVTGSVSKVTGGIVRGADWITSPIDGAQRITSA